MIGWEPKITKVIYSWVEGHFLPTSGLLLFPQEYYLYYTTYED